MSRWLPRRQLGRLLPPGLWHLSYKIMEPISIPEIDLHDPVGPVSKTRIAEAEMVAFRQVVDARESERLDVRILGAVQDVKEEVDAFLQREGYLADPSDVELVVEVRARVKAWPEVEGVTT